MVEADFKYDVFLSHNSKDKPVVEKIARILRDEYGLRVWLDKWNLTPGKPWQEELEDGLEYSETIAVFLGEAGIGKWENEEMRVAVNSRVNDASRRVIPVLIPSAPESPKLSVFLSRYTWVDLRTGFDTKDLLYRLYCGITGQAPGDYAAFIASKTMEDIKLKQEKNLFTGISVLPPEMINYKSQLYIERDCDGSLVNALSRDDITIVVKGSKKMGKSLLLQKAIETNLESTSKIILIDFKLFERDTLNSPDVFYRQFCSYISLKLHIKDTTGEYWAVPLGNTQRCTIYFESILASLSSKLILAMEDVDKVFLSPFKTDFFSMLRSWHENRRQDSPWRNFAMILVTSTEPYLYIEDPGRSPFNVGTIIELEDFNDDEVSDLNQKYGSPLTKSQEITIMELLHGHPYLVPKTLYLLASHQVDFTQLIEHAVDEKSPFIEHLRDQLNILIDHNELMTGLRQVIHNNLCQDERIYYKLHRAGLVRKEGNSIIPRCKLYSDYFRIHLHD